MAAFCIIKPLAEKLQTAAKSGDITIEGLFNMTSKQRNELFAGYTDKETAKQINAGFENVMVSDQQAVLNKWVKDTFSTEGKPDSVKEAKRKDIVDRINELDNLGVLSPDNQDVFLQDLVATKLGATVTAEEAKTIAEKSKKLEELGTKVENFGDPDDNPEGQVAYAEAKKDLADFLDSLTPSSNMKVATSTIGRGTMLFSLKSPLLNIESNSIQAAMQLLEKRIAGLKFRGDNSAYARRYIKHNYKVFKASGYDMSRMLNMQTDRKYLGEDKPNSQGKGAIKAYGRVVEDVVFKRMMTAPDAAFSSVHFSDSANLLSTKLAQSEGLKGKARQERALAIMKDAFRVEPKTPEGIKVRNQSIADAMYATYTNDSVYSAVALGIRQVFNMASGDLRLGDQIMPFVKTPANVIGSGLDASGIGVPFDGIYRLYRMHQDIKNNGDTFKEAGQEAFQGFSRTMVRAGLGMTAAFVLSSLFDPDDFIGEYPVSEKERELLELKNATTNSLKIGNTWVSLDYFGPLGTPMVAFLYAKKYGDTLPEKMWFYMSGARIQSSKIPGFTETQNMIQALSEDFDEDKNTFEENVTAVSKFGVNFLKARIIPAIVSDLAKVSDTVERQTDKEDVFSSVKAGIPIVRQETVDEKKDIFGDTIKSEGWKTLLFGARVRTAADNELIGELSRLDEAGYLPAISDIMKNSPRAKRLKTQVGNERFSEAMGTFGKWFKDDTAELLQSSGYQSATDQEKKDLIDSVKSDAFEDMLDEYNYQDED